MSTEILIALLSLVGTLVGSMAGVLTSNKLVTYRIEQLEKKVDKHNTVIERTYKLEERAKSLEDKIGEVEGHLEKLEDRKAG